MRRRYERTVRLATFQMIAIVALFLAAIVAVFILTPMRSVFILALSSEFQAY